MLHFSIISKNITVKFTHDNFTNNYYFYALKIVPLVHCFNKLFLECNIILEKLFNIMVSVLLKFRSTRF